MRDGWIETTLGAIASLRSKKVDPSSLDPSCRYVGLEHLATRDSRIQGWGHVVNVSSLVASFEAGDTLFGRLRPYLRKIALAEFAGACSSEILVLSPHADVVLPRFLHLLASSETTIGVSVAKSAGSRMPRTSATDLLAVPVALPPLAEQRRIVDLVAALDETIAAADVLAGRGRASREALLAEILSNPGLDWTEVTLGDVAEIVMGQSPPGNSYNTRGDGIPFIQGSAEFGRRSPSPVQWCSAPKKIAQAGELLVSVRAPVGELNFAESELAVGRGLAIVKGTEAAGTEYLALAMRHGLPKLKQRAQGGMFESITKQGLLGLEIALPPLAEQRRIVDIITAVDEGISAAALVADRGREARSALLSDLLSGGHEIPESYDRLLEGVS